MAMGRLEAHSHEAMDRSKASDRSSKGLYGLLYQPNPCLGPCVVRLRVGEGRRWGSVQRDFGPSYECAEHGAEMLPPGIEPQIF